MLLRREAEDPRKTLKEGAAVTACGVEFLKVLQGDSQVLLPPPSFFKNLERSLSCRTWAKETSFIDSQREKDSDSSLRIVSLLFCMPFTRSYSSELVWSGSSVIFEK